MMSVYEFCGLSTDDGMEVSIFDMNEEVTTEVFVGTMRDAMYDENYSDCVVWSFDLDRGRIMLNIDTSEEE